MVTQAEQGGEEASRALIRILLPAVLVIAVAIYVGSYFLLRDFTDHPDWRCHEIWIGWTEEDRSIGRDWCGLRFLAPDQEQRWLEIVTVDDYDHYGDWYYRRDNPRGYGIYKPLVWLESLLRE